MKIKKITLEKLHETQKGISLIINTIEKVMELEPQNFEEIVCKRYIEVQNVTKIAELLNYEGYRYEGRKFIGKNISEIIKNTKENEIGELANVLFKHNNVLQNGSTSFDKKIKDFKELNSGR